MVATVVARRAGQLVIVLLAVSSLLFLLLHLTGDPASTLAGQDATPATIAAIRSQLGLDQPWWVQYLLFLRGIATLDFGQSLRSSVPALPLVIQRLPYTLLLAAAALVLTTGTSLSLGVWLADRRDTRRAGAVLSTVVVMQSVPGYVVGLLLILLLAVRVHVFPVFGADSPLSLVLPAVTLTAFLAPKVVRLTRSAAISTLNEEFVRVARAKGLPRRMVLWRYVLRNAIATVSAVLTLQLAQLLGGAIIVEAVFAWPGMGSLMVDSVLSNDFPVVQAAVFVVAVLVVAVNLGFDLLLPRLDPRLGPA